MLSWSLGTSFFEFLAEINELSTERKCLANN